MAALREAPPIERRVVITPAEDEPEVDVAGMATPSVSTTPDFHSAPEPVSSPPLMGGGERVHNNVVGKPAPPSGRGTAKGSAERPAQGTPAAKPLVAPAVAQLAPPSRHGTTRSSASRTSKHTPAAKQPVTPAAATVGTRPWRRMNAPERAPAREPRVAVGKAKPPAARGSAGADDGRSSSPSGRSGVSATARPELACVRPVASRGTAVVQAVSTLPIMRSPEPVLNVRTGSV